MYNLRTIKPVSVVVANGATLECTTEGELVIYPSAHKPSSEPITLRNVLYHPLFVDNLLSVGAICRQHGNRVVFEGEHAQLYLDNNFTTPAITIQAHNNLFAITTSSSSTTTAPRALIASTSTSNNAMSRVLAAHNKYAHASLGKLKLLVKNGSIPGMSGVSMSDLKKVKKLYCHACAVAKMTRPPFAQRRRNDEVSRALERVSTDLTGPLPANRFDHRFVSLVIDQWSSFIDVRTMRYKADAPLHVQQALTQLQRQSGLKVQKIRCDGSKENGTLRHYCAANGIILEQTPPYTPQWNGQGERAFRTLGEAIRAMITATGCDSAVEFWPFAYSTAAYVLNITRVRRIVTQVDGEEVVQHLTPYEIMYGKKCDVSHLQPWGCDVIYKNLSHNLTSLTNPGCDGILLGYDWDSWGKYAIYDMVSDRVVYSRDVQFSSPATFNNIRRATSLDEKEAGQMLRQNEFLWNRLNEENSDAVQPHNDEPVQQHQEIPALHDDDVDVGDRHVPLDDNSDYVDSDGGVSDSDNSDANAVPDDLEDQPEHLPPNNNNIIEASANLRSHPNKPTLRENWLNEDDNDLWLSDNVKHAQWLKNDPLLRQRIRNEIIHKPNATNINWKSIAKDPQRMNKLVELLWPSEPQSVDNARDSNSEGEHSGAPSSDDESALVPANHASPSHIVITDDLGDKYYRAYITRSTNVTFAPTVRADPRTREEAMAREDGHKFKEAEERELEALARLGVMEPVDPRSIDPNVPILKLIALYTVKRDEHLQPIKWKCRIVGQGFRQIHGVNYFDTSSPVMKLESLKLLIQLANIFKLQIHQMDVDNAYLNAPLRETVYCRMPKGLEPPGQEGRVYRLVKALYGLKQAGLEWYREFTSTITQLGFVSTKFDPCVFIKPTRTNAKILLGVFVDDVIIIFHSRDEAEWSEIKSAIKSKYGIKDIGTCSKILGMTVDRAVDQRVVHIGQEGYIQKVLDRYQQSDQIRTAYTPGTDLKLLMQPPSGQDVPLDEKGKHEYRELIGNLMYAANTTRIDIATTVNHLSRFNSSPSKYHLIAAQKVLKYLVRAKRLKLVFKGECPIIRDSSGHLISNKERVQFGDGIEADLSLYAFCDATWAEELDECKSTTGFVIMLNGAPLMFKSRKQQTIAKSSSEAEITAMASCADELKWFQGILSELGLRTPQSPPSMIYCDNRSTVTLAGKNLAFTRMKNYAIKYAFLKEEQDAGNLAVKWISGLEQPADGLTKYLDKAKHQAFTSTFMGEC